MRLKNVQILAVWIPLVAINAANAQTGETCGACIAASEGTYFGTTADNPPGLDDSSCGAVDVTSEWYCYTPTCTGRAIATTCGRDTVFDTTMAVHTACDLLTELDCSDDFCGPQSEISWAVTAGTTYYIRIAGALGATGDYELNIACGSGNIEFFLDEAAFLAAATGDNLVTLNPDGIEDFEEAVLPPPPNNSAVIDDPLDASTANGVFSPGDIAAGLVFQSNISFPPNLPAPRGTEGLVVFGPGFMDAANTAVSANFDVDSFDVLFVTPTIALPNALGVDLFCNTDPGLGTTVFRLYDFANSPIGAVRAPADVEGTFLGVSAGDNAAGFFGEPGIAGPICRISSNCSANVASAGPAPAIEGLYDITAYGRCGNGIIDLEEDCDTCPEDVSCPPGTTCRSGLCVSSPCPEDLDGDGNVNATDLAQLLGGWGDCGDCRDCPQDLDGSCQVNAVDLATTLGAWGACQVCEVDADCDDGDLCTMDTCNVETGCSNEAIDCDDKDACTMDSCSPATGDCLNDAVDCDDGDACTLDGCNPASGCFNDPLSCDDGDACTTDTCDPGSGCAYSAVNCDDGDACTVDGCNPVSGCFNNPLSCDDGDACTTDTCDPGSGCAHSAVDCDDGDACTTDTCDPDSGCAHSTVDCDDGDACTDDSCDPVEGCVNTAVPCTAEVIFSNISGHPTAQVPGVAGEQFRPGPMPFERLFGSPNGTYWMFKAFTDNPGPDEVIMAGSGLSGSAAAKEGTLSPVGGLNYAVLDAPCAINESGQFVFGSRLMGGTTASDEVLFKYNGVTTVVAAREGDPAPGLVDPPGTPGDELLGNDLRSMHILADGTVLFRADFIQNVALPFESALYQGSTVLAQEGTMAASGQVYEDFVAALNLPRGDAAGGHWLAEALLPAGVEAAVVDDVVEIADGDVLTGSGSPVSSVLTMVMGGSDNWMVRGSNADGTNWVVLDDAVVLSSGDPVVPGSDELVISTFAVAVNEAGDYVIGVNSDAPPDLNQVMVLNGQDVIAREGGPVDLDGNGSADDDTFIASFDLHDLFVSDDPSADGVDDRMIYFFGVIRDGGGSVLGNAFMRVRVSVP